MFKDLMSLYTSQLIMYQEWLKFLGKDLMPAIVVLGLFSLILIELIKVSGKQSRTILFLSYVTNIATFVFNNSILSILSISSLLLFAEKYRPVGLLSIYCQPIQVLLAFVLFDLSLYLWHKANHDFDCLWMFHKVHHSDKSMNVTTAFRVHLIEVILSTLIKAMFIIVTGIEVSVLIICESVTLIFIMFHHLNITFQTEKWLKWLFVVPSLHRVHHSSLRKEHDSNYGAVFSLWDRMFRTLNELTPVNIGLTNVKTLNFFELIKFGLISNYPAAASDKPLESEKINAMIAEAAYYIAEKRGFVSGYESSDWIEAEQQINNFTCPC